ncbi:MAG TPA: glycerol-3-phosphate dehydrogenase/oxidase [Gaiellaceae bacterium]|nr:glycerol-3-phosphate dehydrogenase/oxidase [Gaiellaceae bacterium]
MNVSVLARRAATLERLEDERFDLLVVGAGIVGSRIAYEAACAGLRVALVDAGDFGGGTSSASSKLLHGGLRYLSTGDLRLVRELRSERLALATRVAPHLVESIPLVIAVEGRSPANVAKLNIALQLYALLSGFEPPQPRRLSIDAAAGLVAPLRRQAVCACGVVTESQTHDARLTLATARAAERAGVVAANYVRVRALEPAVALAEDAIGGERPRIRFRAVVNAAGPAVDVVRALEDARARPLARLSKGTHAVVPLQGEWRGGLALFDEGSTSIALPWHGMLLLGTTDEPCDDATDTSPTPAEIATVLRRFAGVLPNELLRPERVAHSFAGLRALPRGNVATSRAQRRHVVAVGPRGMVSVAGGKLTSHRLIAMDALAQLPPEVRPRRRSPTGTPLGRRCSAANLEYLRRRVDVDVAAHLGRLYGDDARGVAACGDLDRIDPRGPDVWAQVDYALERESAVTVDDVVRRRTTLEVRGLASGAVREAIEARLPTDRSITLDYA